MPSSYSPPDVLVTQIRNTTSGNPYPPQLPVVVVGPAVQIVVQGNAGTYSPSAPFTAPLPSLAPGADVIADTFNAILEVFNSNNEAIGLFLLSGADASLSVDKQSVNVNKGVEIEYSILSNNNNNAVDTTLESDYATGEAEGISFTDINTDFLGLGATTTGNTFISVVSPANMAGLYEIYGFVPDGNSVNTVLVELVDDEGDPVITNTFSILNTELPTGSTFIYGCPATHELLSAPYSDVNNVTPATIGEGIGIASVLATLDTADVTKIVAVASCKIPGLNSNSAVVFAPAAPESGGEDDTGSATPDWVAAFQSIKVGDWVRFTGTFGSTAKIRDFQIMDIDTTYLSITIQNPDATGTSVADYTVTGTPGVSSIEFIRVLKGSEDARNASGDYLTGTALGIPFSVEIAKARPAFLQLTAPFPAASAVVPTAVEVIRGIPFTGECLYDVLQRMDSGYTANVLVSYEANRTDLPLNGLMTLYDERSVINTLGMVHPDNPLALMADMVVRSGLTSSNNTFYALATNDNTIESYQTALTYLSMADVYFVVPATQDLATLEIFNTHVQAQSLPKAKHERVCLGSTALTSIEPLIPLLPTTALVTGVVNALTPTVFTCGSVDWGTVSAGDLLSLMSSSDQATAVTLAQYRISSVGSTSCTLLTPIASEYFGNPQYFEVTSYPLTNAEQAQEWCNEALGMAPGDPTQPGRMMLIRPDSVEITYTDMTGPTNQQLDVIVPTYYAAAVFAGMASYLPPQQPMTNIPIPGLGTLLHSNNYFIDDDLNTIASGGNNVLVQATPLSAPYSRHQLMCNMASLTTREFSIVKLVDFSAKYLRNSLRPYIGNHNITKEFLTQLTGIAEAVLMGLISSLVLMPGTSVTACYQDPDNLDSVIMNISCVVPYPCNRINITLYI